MKMTLLAVYAVNYLVGSTYFCACLVLYFCIAMSFQSLIMHLGNVPSSHYKMSVPVYNKVLLCCGKVSSVCTPLYWEPVQLSRTLQPENISWGNASTSHRYNAAMMEICDPRTSAHWNEKMNMWIVMEWAHTLLLIGILIYRCLTWQ